MARDGAWTRDGARMQSWLRRTHGIRTTERTSAGPGIELGLVLRRHDKDDNTNTNGSVAEYDVLMAETLVVIHNAAVMSLRRSRDSGDEAVLVPASDTPDLSDPTQALQNILGSDGDLVGVSFVGGRFPLIVGTLTHLRSGEDTAPWHGAAADGVRRGVHHGDTHAVIEEDSDVNIDTAQDNVITVNVDGTQVFKLTRTATGSTVELGTGGEALVLGDSFIDALDTVVEAWLTFVSAVGGTPGLAAAATTFSGVLTQFQALLPTYLSDVAETE